MSAGFSGLEAGSYGIAHQIADVYWRAGGGSGGGRSSGGGSSGGSSGGFSGSSSSGFGGSSGSGGAAGALGALIFGGVCLFIIVIFVLVIMKNAKGGGASSGMAGLPGQAMGAMGGSATGEALGNNPYATQITTRGDIDAAIAQITARDPGFNEADFLSDVNRAFFTIQQAWTERRPDISRQVMQDGIWNQHKFQIDQYLSLNKQNILENLAIQNTRTVAANTDDAFDTIVVRFFAKCADYDIDLNSDKRKIIKGDRTEADWAEDWVFQRSSKATTKPNGGTMAKKCPNCGAPLDLDLAGICKYCKAPVMSGEFDWVLTRIEQLPSYEMAQATVPA
jgi:predicted lipid-binding transport protein (Tim44 family)